ncbi:hypothetical protein [Absidia glauca]|uniref:RING-type domain-containing protein n=1 Tax=Absidia glauca TaxID=4829 RepID=A0A163JHN8_ABSGL|nr:hypothetical protein [Absidia glauca]
MWWYYPFLLFVFGGKHLKSVHAFSFFEGTGAKIVQDMILLYTNSSSIDRTCSDFSPIFYDDNISPVTSNMERMDKTGLRGILYDQGYSCSSSMTNPNTSASVLPSPFLANASISVENKVALIKSEGSCSLIDQITYAQRDGAHACIIYASQPGSPSFKPPEIIDNTSVTIPVFYVQKQIGQNLYKLLSDLSNNSQAVTFVSTNVTAARTVRVLLVPPAGGTPNPWEITLMILIIVLAVGFMSSVCLHLYLWRRQKKLQQLIESGHLPPTPDMLPMNKRLMTPSKLDLFPTRLISPEDTSKVSSRQSVHSHVSTNDDNACVICLDTLSVGQKVRQLPCLHEYHCDCIDPWLTSKSGECPLCKFDCVGHVTTPEEQKATEEAHAYYTNTEVNVLQVVTEFIRHRFGRSAPPSH